MSIKIEKLVSTKMELEEMIDKLMRTRNCPCLTFGARDFAEYFSFINQDREQKNMSYGSCSGIDQCPMREQRDNEIKRANEYAKQYRTIRRPKV